MFSHRTQTLFIVIFWTCSMSWLGWTKLRPSARLDQAPRQGDLLPQKVAAMPPVRWSIELDGRPLGWAEQRIERFEDGQGTITSRVHFAKLSLENVFKRGLGSLATLATRGLGATPADLTLTIDNTMRFDHFGQLVGFRSDVREQSWGECIRLRGAVFDDHLVVKAYLGMGEDELVRQEPLQEFRLPLPTERLLVDSLAPRPRFAKLRVGQTWQFESYNPLLPTQPMQSVRARVIGKETIELADGPTRTFHVVYERDDESGLSIDQPLGDVWVRADGTVVRQVVHWGSLRLAFDRLPSDAVTEE